MIELIRLFVNEIYDMLFVSSILFLISTLYVIIFKLRERINTENPDIKYNPSTKTKLLILLSISLIITYLI